MNYKEVLNSIEYKIESLIEDLVEDKVYKSPKTEERLTALCLSRKYIKEKIKDENFTVLNRVNTSIIETEVQNEGGINE